MFLNGQWVGLHTDATMLCDSLRQLRRKRNIDAETAIVRDMQNNELRIFTDGGRACRPLYVVGPDQRLAIKSEHIAWIIAGTKSPLKTGEDGDMLDASQQMQTGM